MIYVYVWYLIVKKWFQVLILLLMAWNLPMECCLYNIYIIYMLYIYIYTS